MTYIKQKAIQKDTPGFSKRGSSVKTALASRPLDFFCSCLTFTTHSSELLNFLDPSSITHDDMDDFSFLGSDPDFVKFLKSLRLGPMRSKRLSKVWLCFSC